jgi:hypothetical protein
MTDSKLKPSIPAIHIIVTSFGLVQRVKKSPVALYNRAQMALTDNVNNMSGYKIYF